MALLYWLPLTNDASNYGLTDTEFITNDMAYTAGKLGNCATFNGSTSKVYANGVNIKNIWSVCAWAKLTPTGSTQMIFHLGTAGSYNQTQFLIHAHSTDQGRVYVVCNKNSTNVVTGSDYSLWTHYCLTFDGTKVMLYINGVSVWSKNITNEYYSGTRLCVGNYYASGCYANGQIQDFRVYDNVLSPKEIEIIARGLVCHYPLNHEGFGQDNLFPGSYDLASSNWWMGTNGSIGVDTDGMGMGTLFGTTSNWSACLNGGFIPYSQVRDKTITVSFWIKSTVAYGWKLSHSLCTATSSSRTLYGWIPPAGSADVMLPTEWQRMSLTKTITDDTFLQGSGTITPESDRFYLQFYCHNANTTVYIKGVKVEIGDVPTPYSFNPADAMYSSMGLDSNVIQDTSGNDNNLTIHGALTYSSGSPRYGCCIGGFTNSQYLDGASPTDQVRTVSFWINTPKANSTIAFIDYKSNLGFGFYNGYIIPNCYPDNTRQKKMYYADSIIANTWHHIVLVRDDDYTDVDLWIDGVKQTNRHSGNYWINNDDSLYIGKRSTGNGMNCMISDFRMYATQLNESQILELYHTAESLSNNGTLMAYDFIEGSVI